MQGVAIGASGTHRVSGSCAQTSSRSTSRRTGGAGQMCVFLAPSCNGCLRCALPTREALPAAELVSCADPSLLPLLLDRHGPSLLLQARPEAKWRCSQASWLLHAGGHAALPCGDEAQQLVGVSPSAGLCSSRTSSSGGSPRSRRRAQAGLHALVTGPGSQLPLSPTTPLPAAVSAGALISLWLPRSWAAAMRPLCTSPSARPQAPRSRSRCTTAASCRSSTTTKCTGKSASTAAWTTRTCCSWCVGPTHSSRGQQLQQ